MSFVITMHTVSLCTAALFMDSGGKNALKNCKEVKTNAKIKTVCQLYDSSYDDVS